MGGLCGLQRYDIAFGGRRRSWASLMSRRRGATTLSNRNLAYEDRRCVWSILSPITYSRGKTTRSHDLDRPRRHRECPRTTRRPKGCSPSRGEWRHPSTPCTRMTRTPIGLAGALRSLRRRVSAPRSWPSPRSCRLAGPRVTNTSACCASRSSSVAVNLSTKTRFHSLEAKFEVKIITPRSWCVDNISKSDSPPAFSNGKPRQFGVGHSLAPPHAEEPAVTNICLAERGIVQAREGSQQRMSASRGDHDDLCRARPCLAFDICVS
jgi:hypothetical protein